MRRGACVARAAHERGACGRTSGACEWLDGKHVVHIFADSLQTRLHSIKIVHDHVAG
jgi:hypothetical protein